MIAPGVTVVDVEPDGFGLLCSLVSRHDRAGAELHVLHDKGRVLRVVHTLKGPQRSYGSQLGDLPRAAAKLRQQTGVDRVVLVDRDGLVGQSHDFAAVGPGDVDQPTAIRRSNELFWSSPAVVTDPAPPSWESWVRLEQHLRSLGDDYEGLLAGFDGDQCAFTLLARFVDGRIVHLTSLHDRDPLEVAATLPLALVAPLDVLRAVATADDLPAALAACAPQALISRGLPT